MKINKIKHFFVASTALFVWGTSSCDYLNVDDYFKDLVSIDSVFATTENVERYLWGAAGHLQDEGAIWGSNWVPGVTASDEAFTMWDHDEYPGVNFVTDKLTPDYSGYGFSQFNIWNRMYMIIRKTNTILKRIKECQDMTTLKEREILGYTHFLRAYAYYHLLMSYGPPVLLGDEVLETNQTPDYYIRYRSTYDEACDYICTEFETAAKYMPAFVTVNQFGRPTRGAAYALVARVRLQQASPLFNGGLAARKYFSGWTRQSDGADYVSQNYDEKKWAVAAHAAKRVIDMGMYSLHTVKADENTPQLPSNVPAAEFPNGAGGIDHLKSYADMFNGEAIAYKNPEFIFARKSGSVTGYTKHSFPVVGLGGWNGMAVPQKIVDAYYMVDGKTIEDSSAEYPYREDDDSFTSNKTTFSGYQLNNNVYGMYVNREMRFYASIGFSECFWPCLSTSENNKKNKTVTYYLGGTAGRDQTDGDLRNYPATGYVTKKYIHKDDAWSGNDSERLPKSFPIIRYAEILLSYAEALNNLTTSHTITDEEGNSYTYSRDVNEIAKAFNPVRFRAGLPGLTSSELSSASTIQSVLERERMIELFHENRRFYDVRRWGIVAEEESKPIMGMDPEKRKDNGYYTRVIVNHALVRNRVFKPKMIFLPINRQEIRKVPTLDQNPGWDN